MRWRLPSWRDWRAARIGDPVERLRYLRRAAVPRRAMGRRTQLAAVAIAAAALIPAPIASGSREVVDREQRMLRSTAEAMPKVWLVEQNGSVETYSNGLRIDNSLKVAGKPRVMYPIYLKGEPAGFATAPAGIVFHTTESHLLPFEASENARLQFVGRNLLDFIGKQQAYHYVIDRFGRVYRIVADGEMASHAGWSVWADSQGAYVNLNQSFLGIAFEAQTQAGPGQVQPAQIHAARMLTEMLRARYNIRASNCVTHAQVSVNEQNLHIAYHTDWAGSFPFRQLGLPDNYEQPVGGMVEFGFEYDSVFEKAMSGKLWPGILVAEDDIRQQAAAHGLAPSQWKQKLQQRFRRIAEQIVAANKGREGDEHETKR